ncbi:hypothetical protein [Blastomonas fulva]|nr:hypothetical protein [Blastomonas fulva]MDM7928698.1 hypothetical protein [Blastomonas fulva]MDM7964484.1 hypothetical protein [Blastomonas fulva]
MIDGRPATWRESLTFWGVALVASIPGAALYVAIAWLAGAWS